MKYVCLALISAGALIMAYCIYAYFYTLLYMRQQNYDKEIFNKWVYKATLLMMTFFLVGYLAVLIILASIPYESFFILISFILFFGALFVLSMVYVQRLMSETITSKTDEIIQSLIQAIEAKDIYTKGHSEQVRNLTALIYEYLPQHLQKTLNFVHLTDAALLHDIGKIAIPDNILNKPDRLTQEEFDIIKSHPQNGMNILQNTSYRNVGEWVLYHHERVDGTGYFGLSGPEIPLAAQIISLADVFSALHTDRVYRKKFSYAEAMAIIKQEVGAAFDAELVTTFCAIPENRIEEGMELAQ